MSKLTREALLWALILLPLFYLFRIWDQLPEQVATHFNLQGEADRYSERNSLIYIVASLSILVYLTMLLIPFIDPKKKIVLMGDNYFRLRFLLSFFMSIISYYIIYAAYKGSLHNPNILIAIIGVFFAMLGNYFQALRPNYFIGIRTPWTLESEEVWKTTHRFGGKLWIIGGLSIAIISWFLSSNKMLFIFSVIMFLLMALIPVIYSFVLFKKRRM